MRDYVGDVTFVPKIKAIGASQHRGEILFSRGFVRLFVKRFALCYRTVVYTVCVSVCPICLWRWSIVVKRLDGSRCHLVQR